MPKPEKKQLSLTANNDFDLPPVDSLKEDITPNNDKKIIRQKESFVRLNLDRIPVVKVGFELPETDDQEIELIAIKERKTKKDLLAEIVKDWLRRNKM